VRDCIVFYEIIDGVHKLWGTRKSIHSTIMPVQLVEDTDLRDLEKALSTKHKGLKCNLISLTFLVSK
jgi:hypothetical protein